MTQREVPRLHQHCRLELAAEWLSSQSTEVWQVETVLHRMLERVDEKNPTLSNGRIDASLPSVTVLLPKGTELVRGDGTGHRVLPQPHMVKVDSFYFREFVRALYEYEEMFEPIVFDSEGGGHWRVLGAVSREAIRLTPAQIDSLLTNFDVFVLSGRAEALIRSLEDGGDLEAAVDMDACPGTAPPDALGLAGTSPSMGSPKPAQPRPQVVTREKKSGLQREAVLAAIRALGYDPSALPKRENGLAGIKTRVRDHLLKKDAGLFPSLAPKRYDKGFLRAWEDLRSMKMISESQI